MATQARGAATRRRIMDAALAHFDEVGYASATLTGVVAASGLSKGAFYHHFDTKEAVADALITEGFTRAWSRFGDVSDPVRPALESMLRGAIAVADFVTTDPYSRMASRLLIASGQPTAESERMYTAWVSLFCNQIQLCIDQGDMRADVDPLALAHTVIGATLGADLVAKSLSDSTDPASTIAGLWDHLLERVAPPESVEYLREFLRRVVEQRSRATAPQPT